LLFRAARIGVATLACFWRQVIIALADESWTILNGLVIGAVWLLLLDLAYWNIPSVTNIALHLDFWFPIRSSLRGLFRQLPYRCGMHRSSRYILHII
jgi:hypothetical protein